MRSSVTHHIRVRLPLAVLALVACALTNLSSAQTSALAPTCVPSWVPTFGELPGVRPLLTNLTVFDDGSGPALFAGGFFSNAGGIPANRIAKWDGANWSALGDGFDDAVRATAVYDDGTGPALYAGGTFFRSGAQFRFAIAKWNGTSWDDVGGGLNPGDVSSLVTWDDGTGSALYVATQGNVVKWNGSVWSNVGSPFSFFDTVEVLAVFDDGNGPRLYAAGDLSGVANVAKFNGTAWVPLGSGTNNIVFALDVYDDGSGPALYAGGAFTSAGGSPASGLAKWNGASWSAVGGGVDTHYVSTLGVYDDGAGEELYVSGSFTSAGGTPANNVAKWNGASWSALGSGTAPSNSSAYAFLPFDDGTGPALFVAGNFLSVGDIGALGIARWKASTWSALNPGLNGDVHAVATLDIGSGAALYTSGDFTHAAGVAMNHIGKWDGANWSPLGAGLDATASALTSFDDGGGSAVYAGGAFTTAGAVAANKVAKWNGASWSALGAGPNMQIVNALTAFDAGAGPKLHAAGFGNPFGGPTNIGMVSRWDGASWTLLGSQGFNQSVATLCVHDDGSGAALYAGGSFTLANGLPVVRVAKWNGSAWTTVGGGTDGPVAKLVVFDFGGGPELVAAGSFANAGGSPASHIARWNGATWSPIGAGLNANTAVGDLRAFDDGTGSTLYVAANVATPVGTPAPGIVRWNGATWTTIANGVHGFMDALAVFSDASGPALYVGGPFTRMLDSGDAFLAKWGCAAPTQNTAFCLGDGTGAACPCVNGALGNGCANSVFASGSNLAFAGVASVSADTAVLSATNLSGSIALFYQGATQITPVVLDDGLGCVGNPIVRLGTKPVTSATSSYPLPGNPRISVRGAIPVIGGTYSYQCLYRNAAVTFCPPATSNRTNGQIVQWSP